MCCATVPTPVTRLELLRDGFSFYCFEGDFCDLKCVCVFLETRDLILTTILQRL